MWKELPINQKLEYKKMILAFASLTEMFAQKAETDDKQNIVYSPIINSKYQETVFQKVFTANAEDIGNTSFDASLCQINENGTRTKYLIGIKTFGVASGNQKVAQFKANHDEWSEILNDIKNNALNKSKDEINFINKELYKELAFKIATLRNMRIESSIANIQGFSISVGKDDIKTVYHVLMPSKKGDLPKIYVGEISYDKIDINKLEIIGCSSNKNPTNFDFTDGNHKYHFTSADSQLLMDFKNKEIIQDEWNVKYAEDAYSIFSELAERVYTKSQAKIVESYSWLITNNNDEVERYSGFNNFYGLGSKLSKDARNERIERLYKDFDSDNIKSVSILNKTKDFLFLEAHNLEERIKKENLRNEILEKLKYIHDIKFKDEILKLIFRPINEMYIPIPNSRLFHTEHPDFFGKDYGLFQESNPKKMLLPKAKFNLVFEPSEEKIECFITQDFGKGIESVEKQSYLGEWILRKIFQLKKYEPLTSKRLNELEINAIRLYKTDKTNDIHLEFIWIDKEKLPNDFLSK